MRPLIVKKFDITFNEEFLNPQEICSEDANIDIKFIINGCNTFEITNISFLEKDNLINSLSSILDDKDSKIIFDDFSNIYLETTRETLHFYINFDKGDGFITTSIKYENNALVKKKIRNFIKNLEKINLLPQKEFENLFNSKEFEKEMKQFQINFEKNISTKPEITNELINLQEKYSLNIFKNTSNLNDVLFIKFTDLLQKISLIENTEESLELIKEFKYYCENNFQPNEEVQEPTEEVNELSEEVQEPTEEVNELSEELQESTEEVNVNEPTEKVNEQE
jgi:methyl-accepting chemotaxis protein